MTVSPDVRDEVRAGQVEQALARIEQQVTERFPEIRRVFTEVRAREHQDRPQRTG